MRPPRAGLRRRAFSIAPRTALEASVVALLSLSLWPSRVSAQTIGLTRRVGLGAVVGFPDNGVSFNYFFDRRYSLQADATFVANAYWFGLGVRADVLFWMPTIATFDWASLVWYLGPGGRFGVRLGGGTGTQPVGLGAEFLFGIGFQWRRHPIELLLDGGPVLNLIDASGYPQVFSGTVAVRFRYYF